MKRLLLLLSIVFLMSGISSFAQDTKPVDANNKSLQAPNHQDFYYNIVTHKIGLWKGGTFLWNEFFSASQVQTKIDSLAYVKTDSVTGTSPIVVTKTSQKVYNVSINPADCDNPGSISAADQCFLDSLHLIGIIPYPGMDGSTWSGGWDANSNTPTLSNATGTLGYYYNVTVSGTVDFGAGAISFQAWEYDVWYNGTVWVKHAHAFLGIRCLNGQFGWYQSFANGTAGTAPAFGSTMDTHTLNIPYASKPGVTLGGISHAEYDSITNCWNKQEITEADTTRWSLGYAAYLWGNHASAGYLTGLTVDSPLSGLGTTASHLTVDLSSKENTFSKNTGFNKNFGSIAGTVLEGRTFGTAANSATGDFIQNQGASAQSGNTWISGNHRVSTNSWIGTDIGASYIPDDGVFGSQFNNGGGLVIKTGGTESTRIYANKDYLFTAQNFQINNINGETVKINQVTSGQNTALSFLSGGVDKFVFQYINDGSGRFRLYNYGAGESFSIASDNKITFSSTVDATSYKIAGVSTFLDWSRTGYAGNANQILIQPTNNATSPAWSNWFKADWNQTDSTKNNWIRNKPTIPSTTLFTTVALSDEATDLVAGTSIRTFRMPVACTITAVRLSCNTAPTGSTIIVDINESGTSILSTKLSIDASELTSTTAASAAVISDATIADDAEMTIDIDQVGSTIAGKGLKLIIYYTKN